VETKKEVVLRGPSGLIISMAYSSDGKFLAAGTIDGVVWLWDVSSGEGQRVFGGLRGGVWTVAFSPDGRWLACGCGPEPPRHEMIDSRLSAALRTTDGEVRLWSMTDRRPKAVFRGHTGRIRSVAFHPDGQSLASGSDDNTMRLWEIPPQ
jgi:WD40 repeat protein